jgi:hypothetical protein
MSGLGSLVTFQAFDEGILERGSETIRAAIDLRKAAVLAASTPMPSGVLRNNGADLDPKEVAGLLAAWKNARNNRATAYLTSTLEYQPTSFSPKDMMYDKAQQPTNFKIKVFTIADIKLYHFSYTENIIIETKLKKENAVITSNEIWELSTTKLKILGNIQTISQIKEIQFLDKNKTASQTVDKTRKEGFEFTLTKDFEVHLSTKTQTNKYKFNTTTRRFDPKK